MLSKGPLPGRLAGLMNTGELAVGVAEPYEEEEEEEADEGDAEVGAVARYDDLL